MNHINNVSEIISEINNYDLLYLGNKDVYDKYIQKKHIDYEYIINDVKKYKKEIKNKINKLLQNYIDASINNTNLLRKNNNDTIKYKNHFYYFLLNLIDNIKYQEFKNIIQSDLSGCTNHVESNVINEKTFIDTDISNNLYINNAFQFASHNIDTKKISTLDNFVKKNKKPVNKILPKKR